MCAVRQAGAEPCAVKRLSSLPMCHSGAVRRPLASSAVVPTYSGSSAGYVTAAGCRLPEDWEMTGAVGSWRRDSGKAGGGDGVACWGRFVRSRAGEGWVVC